MATELATSPWACPPIPSATARSRRVVAAESWFMALRRPTSDPAAERRVGDMTTPCQTASADVDLHTRLADEVGRAGPRARSGWRPGEPPRARRRRLDIGPP